MTITLLAVSLNEQPLSQPITAFFDANGGTIGRADHNTMALPDPERHISRLQAEIMCTGARYLIKNVGAANPIVVGGRSLSQGESAPLTDRDQIRIGGYLLQVVLDPDDDLRGADVTRGRAVVAATSQPDQRPDARPREAAVITSPRPPAPAPIGGMADFGTPLSSTNPFADLMGSPPPTAGGTPLPPVSTGNTFADLMPAPAGVRAGSSALGGAPNANVGAARLPDDFDPFATPAPARAPAAPPPAPGAGLFDDLVPSAAPASIDDAFGLRQAAGRDPLADFMAGLPAGGGTGSAGPAPASPGGLPTDPLALFGGSDRPAPSSAPVAPNHTPDLMAGFVPPQVVNPPMAPPPVVPPPPVANPVLPTRFDWQVQPPAPAPAPALNPVVPPAPAAGGFAHAPKGATELDFEFSTTSGLRKPTPGAAFGTPAAPPPAMPAPPVAPPPVAAARPAPGVAAGRGAGGPGSEALWHAFCQGAGVDPSLSAGLDEAMMHDIGALLRSAVDGTLQLMAVRATTKHELRAAVTIIQQRGNNPLKFSPDATTGLEQLLRPTMRGFLSGPAAMTDAMHDLVGHAIGTVAGMRAALDGMLERFAPSELESKLVGKSLLDSVLPMNRKAKLWELYLQHFESIREEAQEDFHSLFGKAFLAAYEQQLERLKQQGGAAG